MARRKQSNQAGGAIAAVVLAVIALAVWIFWRRGDGDIMAGVSELTGIDLQAQAPDWFKGEPDTWSQIPEYYQGQHILANELAKASEERSQVLQQSGIAVTGNSGQYSGRPENITGESVLTFEGWTSNIVETNPGWYEIRVNYNGTQGSLTAETFSGVDLSPQRCENHPDKTLCAKVSRLFAEYDRLINSGVIVPPKV